MNDCIFCKIVHRTMSTEILYESDNSIVFRDIEPSALVHLLIVPKKHIAEFYLLTKEDKEIELDIIETVKKMIEKYDLMDKGYRITSNGGGAQAVNHFHIHLLGEINKKRKI